MTDALAFLTDINLDDLVSSFGWQHSPRLAAALRTVFHRSAKKFAAQMLAFDHQVGEIGLQAAALQLIRQFAASETVFGLENLPASAPILVLSNHPGMVDTLALFAALARHDLRIIALDRPFLQALPNVSAKLFYLSESPAERMAVVRKVANHLKSGSAALTFPAGQIEPDPAVYPGALQALEKWTDSAGVFLRFAPETRIIPAVVRNVLWDKAVKHPLTLLKPKGEEREKLGAAIQLLLHIQFDLRPLTVSVQFGAPLTLAEIGSTETAAIHAAVLQRMGAMLENPPSQAGRSIL